MGRRERETGLGVFWVDRLFSFTENVNFALWFFFFPLFIEEIFFFFRFGIGNLHNSFFFFSSECCSSVCVLLNLKVIPSIFFLLFQITICFWLTTIYFSLVIILL